MTNRSCKGICERYRVRRTGPRSKLYDPVNRVGYCTACTVFMRGDEVKNRCVCCGQLLRVKRRVTKVKHSATYHETLRLLRKEENKKIQELGETPLTIAIAKRLGRRSSKKYEDS